MTPWSCDGLAVNDVCWRFWPAAFCSLLIKQAFSRSMKTVLLALPLHGWNTVDVQALAVLLLRPLRSVFSTSHGLRPLPEPWGEN